MFLKFLRSSLALFLTISLSGKLLLCQDKANAADKTARIRDLARKIEARDRALNGIMVGQPKVYDDSLLQQMLNAAQARLISLQILDQSGIATRLGSITGARQAISSFGFSLQGPPLPQVVTTNSGATNSTSTTDSTPPGASSSTSTNSVGTAANAPETSVTTAPLVSAPSVSAPPPSTTLPTSFSVSASDILNEQMQLTYEIASLRLLLEGSLNDRIVGDTKIVKPRVTLGFPVTLVPDNRYKDAIAVVEVEIEKGPEDLDSKEPPAILALLPRERTYNVASITDKNISIGGGVVVQVASAAGSFLRGSKTYYLVQDQDTVALTFQPENPQHVGFLWQFRPVLGAEYVKPGLKQAFAQLAFPAPWSTVCFGQIHVKTYWRRYDRKHGLPNTILPDSLTEYSKAWPILNSSIEQFPKIFDMTSLEDLGNGQMLVTLKGRFLGGTYVRIGSSILTDGSPGFASRYQEIQFMASIADLATKQVSLGARDGSETALVFDKTQFGAGNALQVTGYSLITVDDINSKLSVQINGLRPTNQQPPLVFVIGGKAFGYADAPIRRNGNELSVELPTAFLVANPDVVIKSLFTDIGYWRNARFQLNEFIPGAQNPKLVLLEARTDSAKFLLYGNALDQAVIVSPPGTKTEAFGTPPSPDIRIVSLTRDQLKFEKQLALQMKSGLVFLVPIPSVELADSTKPAVKPILTGGRSKPTK